MVTGLELRTVDSFAVGHRFSIEAFEHVSFKVADWAELRLSHHQDGSWLLELAEL